MADSASQAPDRSKFSTNFLYKALLVTLILLLLPLFPSIAPEFVNQTLHARSWELLQLIFVGIAVSYGLFSNRIHETEKEHDGGNTQSQSYMAKLLQVSSVCEDESEIPEEDGSDHKVETETLHSKYYKQESEGGVEVTLKPLLLPVRSLKQGSVDEDEDMVLPSPIPWRSRSGRMMKMKEEIGLNSISDVSVSTSSTPNKASESDVVKKKNHFSFSPPPAPPPPPPHQFVRTSNSRFLTNNAVSPEKTKSVRAYGLVVGTEDLLDEKKVTDRDLDEKVMMETSEEDSDGESIGEEDFVVRGEAKTDDNSVNDVGPDVDKKADEFIAKFREQIRQQRIESIRRSTAQRVGKSLR